MALITAFSPSIAGTAPTFNAAAANDTAEVGVGLWLIVRNDDVADKTVTIATPGLLTTGDAYPDKAYTVTAGTEAWIPLLADYRDPSDGLAHITWSATTSVTRAVVRMR